MPKQKPKTQTKTATALRYDPNREEAPRVIASGHGDVAQRILNIAQAAGVPVHTDSTLAELLGHLHLGAEIPPELYQVIAEVLAFVYRIDQKAGTR